MENKLRYQHAQSGTGLIDDLKKGFNKTKKVFNTTTKTNN